MIGKYHERNKNRLEAVMGKNATVCNQAGETAVFLTAQIAIREDVTFKATDIATK